MTRTEKAIRDFCGHHADWWPSTTQVQEMLALAQPEQCQCPNCRVTLHASDCAVHNEPAYPKGACNCGAQPEQEPVAYDKTEMNCFVQDLYDKKMLEGKHGHYETMFHVVHQAIKKVPPQRTWVEPTDEEINLLAKAYSTMEGELNAPAFARAILRKAQE